MAQDEVMMWLWMSVWKLRKLISTQKRSEKVHEWMRWRWRADMKRRWSEKAEHDSAADSNANTNNGKYLRNSSLKYETLDRTFVAVHDGHGDHRHVRPRAIFAEMEHDLDALFVVSNHWWHSTWKKNSSVIRNWRLVNITKRKVCIATIDLSCN